MNTGVSCSVVTVIAKSSVSVSILDHVQTRKNESKIDTQNNYVSESTKKYRLFIT